MRNASHDEQPGPRRRSLFGRIARGLLLTAGIIVGLLAGAWWYMIRVPGESFRGPLPPLEVSQQQLSAELQGYVEHLAGEIGERNLTKYENLLAAVQFLTQELKAAGYDVSGQVYEESRSGQKSANIEVEVKGALHPEEIVLVGAHYDSYEGTPGANDNASGAAAVLALAKLFAKSEPERTLRFVFFTNEEPPYFQTADMGSAQYAKRCRERDEDLVAVLSIETIGYYSDEPGSQKYPPVFDQFYPSKGDFIAVIGDVGSRPLVHQVVELFRKNAKFPSEGAAVPGQIQGVGWSDHWSFWQEGYQAVMITDTAPFRYAHYHKATDTPEKLNYDHMARVVSALEGVVRELGK